MVRGLDGANDTRASGGGRKMFLTSPYIHVLDMFVTCEERAAEVKFGSVLICPCVIVSRSSSGPVDGAPEKWSDE